LSDQPSNPSPRAYDLFPNYVVKSTDDAPEPMKTPAEAVRARPYGRAERVQVGSTTHPLPLIEPCNPVETHDPSPAADASARR
jgi:hypothetical protein